MTTPNWRKLIRKLESIPLRTDMIKCHLDLAMQVNKTLWGLRPFTYVGLMGLYSLGVYSTLSDLSG